MVDPIADMLTCILNAGKVAKPSLEVPFSKLKGEVAKVLVKEGFLQEAEQKGRKGRKVLALVLEYNEKAPALGGAKRISKPGQKMYVSSRGLLKAKRAGGMLIVSTSKGVMTDRDARKAKVGGEVLCEVWA